MGRLYLGLTNECSDHHEACFGPALIDNISTHNKTWSGNFNDGCHD